MNTDILPVLAPWILGLITLLLFRGVYELYPKKRDVKGT
jgi:hypothetical protein